MFLFFSICWMWSKHRISWNPGFDLFHQLKVILNWGATFWVMAHPKLSFLGGSGFADSQRWKEVTQFAETHTLFLTWETKRTGLWWMDELDCTEWVWIVPWLYEYTIIMIYLEWRNLARSGQDNLMNIYIYFRGWNTNGLRIPEPRSDSTNQLGTISS